MMRALIAFFCFLLVSCGQLCLPVVRGDKNIQIKKELPTIKKVK